VLPAVVIGPCTREMPEECSLGTSPTKEPMVLPVKRRQSPISTARANPVRVLTARRHPSRCTLSVNSESAAIHDSASVGDAVALPYEPQVVVISENKDTAVGFPPGAGGIAVEWVGSGGGTHARFDWIRDAPLAFCWGDMDADGWRSSTGSG